MAWFIVVGLILNAAGVLLLFRYGMPYHVPSGGALALGTGRTDFVAITREALYRRLGYLGLALVLFGTLGQIIGALPFRL